MRIIQFLRTIIEVAVGQENNQASILGYSQVFHLVSQVVIACFRGLFIGDIPSRTVPNDDILVVDIRYVNYPV